MNREIKIRQRKDDCHYETSFEVYQKSWPSGGYVPIAIGYGFTQEQADTNAFNNFILSPQPPKPKI